MPIASTSAKDLIRKIEVAERFPSIEFARRCDQALGAGGALFQLLPLIDREHRVRAERGFDAHALDRPVLDWLIEEPQPSSLPVRADDVDATDDAVALRKLRQRDHAIGAGNVYADLVALLKRLPAARDLHRRPMGRKFVEFAVGVCELAGYEAIDLGHDGLAQQHYLHGLALATAGGDRQYGGYLIGVNLAHLALHRGDVQTAIRLVGAALRGTADCATPAMQAAFRVVLARAHARRGDERACTDALGTAEADLARGMDDRDPEWLRYFGAADFADEAAHCFFDLERDAASQREAYAALSLLDPVRIRRRVMDGALVASSLTRSGDLDQACTAGHLAVDHAEQTSSFRCSHRIALMVGHLHPHTGYRPVDELADRAIGVLRRTPVQVLSVAADENPSVQRKLGPKDPVEDLRTGD